MPGRYLPLVNEEIYHVFNQGIDHRPTFTNKWEYHRGISTLAYYQYSKLPFRLSKYLHQKDHNLIGLNFATKDKFVEILSYALMPNHFHFLLRQKKDNGISKFLSNFQNSYTRYFNIKHKRKGPLFLQRFKAVHIETDEQLLHVSRYIHLNPYTSYLVKTKNELYNYPWFSLGEYIADHANSVCEIQTIKSFFKNKKELKEFVFNQAKYQRELKQIEHLILE